MTLGPTPVAINTTWAVLHDALTQRRAIRASYHGELRVLCPHALGWKKGRAKALVYQTALIGRSPEQNSRGWRSLFVDEIQTPLITNDPWESAHNYTPHTTAIDTIAAAIT